MGIFKLFRPKKQDDEALLRAKLRRTGRIAEGYVFDVTTDEAGTITQIFFRYTISGVEYEVSQPLDQEQLLRQSEYAPGARITVRYNPRQPGYCVVV